MCGHITNFIKGCLETRSTSPQAQITPLSLIDGWLVKSTIFIYLFIEGFFFQEFFFY